MKRAKVYIAHFSVILALLLPTACQERIDFDFGEPENKLVVDGFITDVLKRHRVRISRTSRLVENIPDQRPIVNATVQLEDDLGRVINLTTLGNGDYLTPVMAASPDRSYRLRIDLFSEIYETGFEQLPTPVFAPQADLIGVVGRREILQGRIIFNRTGAAIIANIEKTDRNVNYQWLIAQCNVPSSLELNPNTRYCPTVNLNEPTVDLLEDIANTGTSGNYSFELRWIIQRDGNPDLPPLKLVVEAEQYLLSQDAFEYWSQIEALVENVGGIFDAAPASIIGNVYNAQTSKPALGYFGVYRESWDRVVLEGFN